MSPTCTPRRRPPRCRLGRWLGPWTPLPRAMRRGSPCRPGGRRSSWTSRAWWVGRQGGGWLVRRGSRTACGLQALRGAVDGATLWRDPFSPVLTHQTISVRDSLPCTPPTADEVAAERVPPSHPVSGKALAMLSPRHARAPHAPTPGGKAMQRPTATHCAMFIHTAPPMQRPQAGAPHLLPRRRQRGPVQGGLLCE